ncbi:MAG: hypothetical protein F6J87_20220 [Spirulina sp. SIO3F2]|nr:hypothetical protein [Spirulina sp. SIO3F2]
MASDLSNFLSSEQLDITQKLANTLISLDQAQTDQAQIRNVIEQWNEQQAIANLLMYPSLIPSDLRLDSLLKALTERVSYSALAAIIGLQGHDDWWSNVERANIVEHLQSIVFGAPQAIANRASITLLDYLRPQDVDKTVFFLGSPHEVVQYNSLLALLRLFDTEVTRHHVNTTFEAGRMTKLGHDYAVAHIDTVQPDDLPLLSYIPNLKDFTTT